MTLCLVNKFICTIYLDSSYKWYHIFVFTRWKFKTLCILKLFVSGNQISMSTLLICLIFGVPKMSHQSVFKIFKKRKERSFLPYSGIDSHRQGWLHGWAACRHRGTLTQKRPRLSLALWCHRLEILISFQSTFPVCAGSHELCSCTGHGRVTSQDSSFKDFRACGRSYEHQCSVTSASWEGGRSKTYLPED